MSVTVSQVIEDVKSLSAKERALLAHCLIQSLDTISNENADDEWSKLANKRYSELKDGSVKPLLWDEIKKEVRS